MKRFFASVGAKIGRFFWSRGFLKFVLWTVTLIILFYVEEDWRGARAWAATKAKWEAKGESLDLRKFIPAPIPDEENLAAIPLFKIEQVEWSTGKLVPENVTLRRAMRNDQAPGNDLPPNPHWRQGELTDMEKIRSTIATDYAAAFKEETPPQETLDQFEALYPFLSDLRAAAATRHLFRFPEDYTVSPPASRALGNMTQALKLSKILTLHAILARNQQQPDLALDDLKINFEIAAGVKRDPTLVAAMVTMGMIAVGDAAIYDGLAHHAWSDTQLVEIDHQLEPINFLADYQFAFRNTAAEAVANVDYFKNTHQHNIYELLGGMSDTSSGFRIARYFPSWPGGWWDNNKSQMATFILGAVAAVDPASHRVFPHVLHDLHQQVASAQARWDADAPWNIWVTLALGPLEPPMEEFAQAQVWNDQLRIAIALERYHLVHGVYPESLEVLSPTFIGELPHDVMNGEPYHYHLQLDGTFLLYSVGGNQKDDGGKVVYDKENPNRASFGEGDWTWPTPQATVTH